MDSDQWQRIKANEDARFELMTGLKPSQRKAFSAWLEPKLPPELLARWPRTETGDLVMRAKRLRTIGLADAHEGVTQYLRANGLATLVSTFGHALAKLVNPATQRLHFRLRIAGARTGRYTSSEPNGQNMPGGPFRRIFAARPGRVILSCDYAAVELRVAALLAGETTLFQVFREPPLDENGKRNPAGDPHVQLSTELALSPDSKLRLAKNLNYGTIYGIGAPGFAVYAGISVEEIGAPPSALERASLQPGAVAAPGRTRDPLHHALADGARPRRQLPDPREAREGRPQVSGPGSASSAASMSRCRARPPRRC